MNYGDLIGEAFRITWRNRFLWVFGFFLGGATVVSPTNFGTVSTNEPAWVLNLERWIENNVGLAIFVLFSTILVFLLVIWALLTLCRAALTESVGALARGERRRFGSTLRGGLSYFWRVLLQSLLLGLISLAIVIPVYLFIAAMFFGLFMGITATDSTAARVVIALACVVVILLLVVALILALMALQIVQRLALRDLILGTPVSYRR